jgi:hypothetical protein
MLIAEYWGFQKVQGRDTWHASSVHLVARTDTPGDLYSLCGKNMSEYEMVQNVVLDGTPFVNRMSCIGIFMRPICRRCLSRAAKSTD